MTNIEYVVNLTSPRALRTRERILGAALDLFERQGYAATTAAQVAAAAGVTEMTFFRHFPTKDAVLVSDPYDPLIAEAVAAQPCDLPALDRVRGGMLAALSTIEPTEDTTAARRAALVATTPALRGAVIAATTATEDAIVDRLVADGGDPFEARVATAACLGACTAAILAMPGMPPPDAGSDSGPDADHTRGTDGSRSLGAVVVRALNLLGSTT